MLNINSARFSSASTRLYFRSAPQQNQQQPTTTTSTGNALHFQSKKITETALYTHLQKEFNKFSTNTSQTSKNKITEQHPLLESIFSSAEQQVNIEQLI